MKKKNKNKKHNTCKTRIQQDFIAKKKRKGYDNKRHPKLMLNIIKVMGDLTSIYTYWAPSSRKFFNFQPTCGSCSPM